MPQGQGQGQGQGHSQASGHHNHNQPPSPPGPPGPPQQQQQHSHQDDEKECPRGSRISCYIVGDTLGQGSFGKVKLATNTSTREKVAIKIVEKATISDVEDVERVYRETFILTSLKHKNIIRLYEVIDTQTSLCLAMEYADGGELFEYVEKKSRLDEIEGCRLFHEIVSGVEYCHRMKIIHRDLKLENILMDSNGTIKIADFGLSNSIKFGQKMNTNCGTPSYTCPEQIDGETYVGSAADIWSMGIILYAMVCGFLPFEAASIPALFKKITTRRFTIPAWVSSECASLIERMLTLDPEKRATIAEIRSHTWYLMDYNADLRDRLASASVVSDDVIQLARKECQAATSGKHVYAGQSPNSPLVSSPAALLTPFTPSTPLVVDTTTTNNNITNDTATIAVTSAATAGTGTATGTATATNTATNTNTNTNTNTATATGAGGLHMTIDAASHPTPSIGISLTPVSGGLASERPMSPSPLPPTIAPKRLLGAESKYASGGRHLQALPAPDESKGKIRNGSPSISGAYSAPGTPTNNTHHSSPRGHTPSPRSASPFLKQNGHFFPHSPHEAKLASTAERKRGHGKHGRNLSVMLPGSVRRSSGKVRNARGLSVDLSSPMSNSLPPSSPALNPSLSPAQRRKMSSISPGSPMSPSFQHPTPAQLSGRPLLSGATGRSSKPSSPSNASTSKPVSKIIAKLTGTSKRASSKNNSHSRSASTTPKSTASSKSHHRRSPTASSIAAASAAAASKRHNRINSSVALPPIFR
jgi:serine/threonine protein kinase